ncbi:MAG: nitroreductase [Lachnospiraceae bacterium]|nr:nitroreductase [Lachnospiraceae bacterium]
MERNQTLDTIFDRASYRGGYKDEPVPREDLKLILEAGLAAPSGCNRQTTSLVAVDEPALLEEIRRIFPKPSCQTAPALILVFTQKIASIDGRFYHVQDYGAAMENMLLAIKALGYDTCWYEGNVRSCAKDLAALMGAPDEAELVCVLPVGRAAEELHRVNKKGFEERAWFNGYRK